MCIWYMHVCSSPWVTALLLGKFVAVWYSYSYSSSESVGYDVFARVYNAEGAAIAGEFQVNDYTAFLLKSIMRMGW